ncbi:DUF1801 domain-containing protein [Brevibacterium album]|uniref:DUF1801 domain-containing protein n=1 Tax=Brevibacterium album TaxID=417948 RepID=UPI00042A1256|nr:DUF1801 domain-containing protein [Brevibacterium album]
MTAHSAQPSSEQPDGRSAKKPAKQPATAPTEADPLEYIRSLEAPRRRVHGELLLEIYGRATGERPVMWGESMVGYGSYDYTYASGWSGTAFRSGFSPRKAKLSLYGLPPHEAAPELWERLGKHTRGAACTYVNKPEDIDLDVLEQLIRLGWERGGQGC